MRSSKGSRRIQVCGVAYRWRASGNDGYIAVSVWPLNNIGAFIQGSFGYHETCVRFGDGRAMSTQIVITTRIIRRIIEHAITHHAYDPNLKGSVVNLQVLDSVIPRDDAVRGWHDIN
jgi:hypothetical protein